MTATTSDPNIDREAMSDAAFRQQYPLWWWATLVGPFGVGFVVLAVVWLVAGSATTGAVVATAVFALLVGRLIIFGGAVAEQAGFFTCEQLFFLALYMDLFPAILVCFHLDLIFDVPHLGPRLKRIVAESRILMRNHAWLRQAAFVTVAVFVFLPVAATGTVFGAIFGRVLGLARGVTFAAVALGSVIGTGLIYFLAEFARTRADLSNPWVTAAMIGFQILLIAGLTILFQRIKGRIAADGAVGGGEEPRP